MKTALSVFIGILVLVAASLLLASGCEKEKELLPILFNPDVEYGIMTDQDGHTYKTVTIGTQTWMAENLRTTKYRNGDPIPEISDKNEWEFLGTGAYCCYDNKKEYSEILGLLYNRYAIEDSRLLAPAGWHISTTEDWSMLTNLLGGELAATRKLKEKGTGHWEITSSHPHNSSGFTALPGGKRLKWESIAGIPVDSPFEYSNLGSEGHWWTDSSGWIVNLSSSMIWGAPPKWGLSVRCVKD